MNMVSHPGVETIEDPVLLGTEPYLSRDYAVAERDRLWRRVWQVACRVEELPAVGDFLTYDVLDDSIIVTRVAPDRIVAYHNVCQHRGRRLVEGTGSSKRFVCKFHGWSWNNDGSCAGVTRKEGYSGKLAMDDIRLKPVRVGEWGGYVFVNMDPDGESLEEFLGEVPHYLGPYQLDQMRFRWRQWLHFPCNWKVAIEAFNEGYHLLATHPQLARYSQKTSWSRPTGLHAHFGAVSGEGVGGATAGAAGAPDMRVGLAQSISQNWNEVFANATQTMVDVANRLVDELPEGTPAHEVQAHLIRRTVEEEAKLGVTWPSIDPAHAARTGIDWHIFPNTVIIPGPAYALCYRVRPDGYDPDKCIFEAYTLQRYADGAEPGAENEHKPEMDETNWRKVLCQDFSNMAEVQQGMKSMGFAGPRPHPVEEQAIINFHRGLARYMGDRIADAATA